MNAAKQYMKSRWIELLIPTVLSCSITMIGLWLGFRDADARDLNKKIDLKADKVEINEVRMEVKSVSEASKIYIDKRMEDHIVAEERSFDNLEKIILLNMKEVKAIMSGVEKYVGSVDKRLERIEDKD